MSVSPSRLRALETARHCATLGARQPTIAYLTGLAPTYILRAVYCAEHPAPKGRPRYNNDFYFRAATKVQAAASVLASHYRTLTSQGFLPSEALIAAFRHLRSTRPATPLSFDEAFYLIANLDGIWAASSRTLSLTRCPLCGHDYIAAASSAHFHRSDGCPVCRTDRAPSGTPIHNSEQHDPRPRPVDSMIAHAKFLQLLLDMGAGSKVAAVLADHTSVRKFRAPSNRLTVTTAHLVKPLCTSGWTSHTHVRVRVQYAVFARWYRHAQQLGMSRAEAVSAGVTRMRASCHHLGKLVTFDRCFEVAALLEGAWGVETPRLQLVSCQKCKSQYVQSLDEERPTPCPFCALVSRHHVLLQRPDARVGAGTPRTSLGAQAAERGAGSSSGTTGGS